MKDIFEGKWNQVKGAIKQKWAKFSDDDIAAMKGKKDELLGKLQEKYGYDKNRAEREVKSLEDEIKN